VLKHPSISSTTAIPHQRTKSQYGARHQLLTIMQLITTAQSMWYVLKSALGPVRQLPCKTQIGKPKLDTVVKSRFHILDKWPRNSILSAESEITLHKQIFLTFRTDFLARSRNSEKCVIWPPYFSSQTTHYTVTATKILPCVL
jgi:hypothetical protein